MFIELPDINGKAVLVNLNHIETVEHSKDRSQVHITFVSGSTVLFDVTMAGMRDVLRTQIMVL